MGRIVHTGDTHIGYLQYHLSSRREDFLEAFRKVVQDAIEGEFDAIVHAGDLFHKVNPDLIDIAGIIEILQLAKDNIPVLAVVGNHEMRRRIQWIDVFERLGLVTHLGKDPYIIEDKKGNVAIYGMDYVHPNGRSGLDYQFEDSSSKYKILVSHGQFTPLVLVPGRDTWDIEKVLKSSNVRFDAVLLGDEHIQKQKKIGDVWVTYCGSTERGSIAERERRSYNIIDLEDGVKISTKKIQTRKFVYMPDIEIPEGEDIGYLYDQIKEQEHGFIDAIVVMTVDGEGIKIPISEVEEYCKNAGAIHVIIKPGEEKIEKAGIKEWVYFEDPAEAVENRIGSMGLSEAAQCIDMLVRDENIVNSNLKMHVKGSIEEIIGESKKFDKVPVQSEIEEIPVDNKEGNGHTLGDFS